MGRPLDGRVDEARPGRRISENRGKLARGGCARKADAVGGGERLVVDVLGDAKPAVVGLGSGSIPMLEGGEDAAPLVVGDDDVKLGPRGRRERQRGGVVAQGQVAHDGSNARGLGSAASIVARFASSVRRGYAGAAQSGGDADGGGNGAVDASLAAV